MQVTRENEMTPDQEKQMNRIEKQMNQGNS